MFPYLTGWSTLFFPWHTLRWSASNGYGWPRVHDWPRALFDHMRILILDHAHIFDHVHIFVHVRIFNHVANLTASHILTRAHVWPRARIWPRAHDWPRARIWPSVHIMLNFVFRSHHGGSPWRNLSPAAQASDIQWKTVWGMEGAWD